MPAASQADCRGRRARQPAQPKGANWRPCSPWPRQNRFHGALRWCDTARASMPQFCGLERLLPPTRRWRAKSGTQARPTSGTRRCDARFGTSAPEAAERLVVEAAVSLRELVRSAVQRYRSAPAGLEAVAELRRLGRLWAVRGCSTVAGDDQRRRPSVRGLRARFRHRRWQVASSPPE